MSLIAQYNGKQIDLDGFPQGQPFQCYDLANRYSLDLGYGRFTGLYASDIFGQQPNNYTWVRNTPNGVPPAGAVVIWDRSKGGGFGHVAVATGTGDKNSFQSLDQNWNGPRVALINHDYSGVIGWGIPKNTNTNTGGGGMGVPNAQYDAVVVDNYNLNLKLREYEQKVRDLTADRDLFKTKAESLQKQVDELKAKLDAKPVNTDTKWETFKSLIRELIK